MSSSIFDATIEVTKDWPEPDIPQDIATALDIHELMAVWQSVTVKARWEWIRFIRSTKNPKTRLSRIATACDMLSQGKKRPCCFDHSRCTITDISKNGILLDD